MEKYTQLLSKEREHILDCMLAGMSIVRPF